MRLHTQFGRTNIGPIIFTACIAAAYFHFKSSTTNSTEAHSPPPQQIAFEAIRTSKSKEYNDTKNELARNKLFKTANLDQDAYWKSNGFLIDGWHGKIDSITTNSTGSAAGVTVNTSQGVTYEQNNIPESSTIFEELSNLKVGDDIYFSGEFSKILKGSAGSLYQEGSLTQYGSLYNPTYGVHLSQIYLYKISPPPSPSLYAPKNSSPTDPFDQSNDNPIEPEAVQAHSSTEQNDSFVFNGVWACTDKLVTAELSDAVKHKMTMAESLELSNECVDISNIQQGGKLVTIGADTFTVPAGTQHVVLLNIYTKASDGSDYMYPNYFYAMLDDYTQLKRH